jgi:hypothetical protein
MPVFISIPGSPEWSRAPLSETERHYWRKNRPREWVREGGQTLQRAGQVQSCAGIVVGFNLSRTWRTTLLVAVSSVAGRGEFPRLLGLAESLSETGDGTCYWWT